MNKLNHFVYLASGCLPLKDNDYDTYELLSDPKGDPLAVSVNPSSISVNDADDDIEDDDTVEQLSHQADDQTAINTDPLSVPINDADDDADTVKISSHQ